MCFSPLEKLIFMLSRHLAICRALKLFLIAISTLPRQLGGSIKKVPGSSIASWRLVDWSRFFSCVFALFLKTFSIAVSVDVVFLNTYLDRWLDTSWHLYLLGITEDLYIGFNAIRSSFSRSLLIYLHLFNSQTLTSLSKPSTHVIFGLSLLQITWYVFFF